MNISVIIFSLSGGAGRVAINLANEMSRVGHNVNLVYGRSKNEADKEINVPINYVQSKGLLSFSLKIIIHRKALAKNILIFEPNLGALLTLPLRLLNPGSNIVWRILTDPTQSLLSNNSYFQRLGKKVFLRLSVNFTDHVIANSYGSSNSFLNVCPMYPKYKISTIYNPITKQQVNTDKSLQSIRSEINLPADCLLLVAAGRLTYQKGFDILLNSYAQALEGLPKPSHLIIFGEGPDRQMLEKQIESNNLTQNVTLYGFTHFFEDYLSQADLFILSSRYEGFGNVLVEALAKNVQIVATDCPSGPREILENGFWGDLVPVGDPTSLARAIVYAVNKTKINGKDRASHFSIEYITKQYINLLESQ